MLKFKYVPKRKDFHLNWKAVLLQTFSPFFESVKTFEEVYTGINFIRTRHPLFLKNFTTEIVETSTNVQTKKIDSKEEQKKLVDLANTSFMKMRYFILAYYTITIEELTTKTVEIQNIRTGLYKQLVLNPINNYVRSLGIPGIEIKLEKMKESQRTRSSVRHANILSSHKSLQLLKSKSFKNNHSKTAANECQVVTNSDIPQVESSELTFKEQNDSHRKREAFKKSKSSFFKCKSANEPAQKESSNPEIVRKVPKKRFKDLIYMKLRKNKSEEEKKIKKQ